MAADTVAGGGANLTKNMWDETIESAVYDRQWFLQRIQKRPRGFNQLSVRKMGVASGQTLTTSQDGTTMTLDSMAPTVVTMAPNWFMVTQAYSDAVPWVSADENVIESAAADNAENSLAAYVETQLLADVASGTNFLGNGAYDIDAAGVRAAVAQLRNNALTLGIPGQAQIYGLFNALQHDDVMSVPEFTHAEQRGDGQNPLVSGVIGKGNAVEFEFTTLGASDANGKHNPIWVRSAFGYFYNSPPRGEKQRYLKQTRFLADCHLGHNVVFNQRFVDVRTKTS